jgi:hypothetical protein
MGYSDWDDPRLREIGRRWAREAYRIADDLEGYGADAAALLEPVDLTRPHHVSIPTMLADVLVAILLTLPRRKEDEPDRSLSENVVALRGKPRERIRFRPLSS